jgi:hypothetical protein
MHNLRDVLVGLFVTRGRACSELLCPLGDGEVRCDSEHVCDTQQPQHEQAARRNIPQHTYS